MATTQHKPTKKRPLYTKQEQSTKQLLSVFQGMRRIGSRLDTSTGIIGHRRQFEFCLITKDCSPAIPVFDFVRLAARALHPIPGLIFLQ
jgi:hypothetical protein